MTKPLSPEREKYIRDQAKQRGWLMTYDAEDLLAEIDRLRADVAKWQEAERLVGSLVTERAAQVGALKRENERLKAENAELLAWKEGRKGVEDYLTTKHEAEQLHAENARLEQALTTQEETIRTLYAAAELRWRWARRWKKAAKHYRNGYATASERISERLRVYTDALEEAAKMCDRWAEAYPNPAYVEAQTARELAGEIRALKPTTE